MMRQLIQILAVVAVSAAVAVTPAAAGQSLEPVATDATAVHAPAQPSPSPAAVGNVQLAYNCGPGQCTCHGDNDCNNMYSGGACKTNGSCETAGGVTCTCATKAMSSSNGSGTVVVRRPPIVLKSKQLKKSSP